MPSNRIAQALIECMSAPLQGSYRVAAGDCAIATRIGRNHVYNEDRAAFARFADGRSAAVIADGIGGMADGAGCAAVAVACFIAALCNGADALAAARCANARVFEHSRGRGGATLTALVADGEPPVALVHLGDTRAWALSGTADARRITVDHTALAALGEHADSLPAGERMGLGAQLTRAAGLGPEVNIDRADGDAPAFVLTSDGIHDFAGRAVQGLRNGPDQAGPATRQLLSVAAQAGTHDDATALWFQPAGVPPIGDAALALWWSGGGDKAQHW